MRLIFDLDIGDETAQEIREQIETGWFGVKQALAVCHDCLPNDIKLTKVEED